MSSAAVHAHACFWGITPDFGASRGDVADRYWLNSLPPHLPFDVWRRTYDGFKLKYLSSRKPAASAELWKHLSLLVSSWEKATSRQILQTGPLKTQMKYPSTKRQLGQNKHLLKAVLKSRNKTTDSSFCQDKQRETDSSSLFSIQTENKPQQSETFRCI